MTNKCLTCIFFELHYGETGYNALGDGKCTFILPGMRSQSAGYTNARDTCNMHVPPLPDTMTERRTWWPSELWT